jgi:4-hydroxybenzoate polyprenyltransferase
MIFLDKEFDKKVFRTKNRPIASGKVSIKVAFSMHQFYVY